MGDYTRIGEMLILKGKITQEQLQASLNGRAEEHRRIGRVLTDLGFVNEWDVAECLAEQFGFDVIDPDKITVDPEALKLLSKEVALAHRILPLRNTQDCIECVMADPIDFPTSDMISRLAQKRVVVHIAPASALINLIRRAYDIESGPSYDRRRSGAKHSAPKPQKDREAILARLNDIANITDKVMPVSHPVGMHTKSPAKGV